MLIDLIRDHGYLSLFLFLCIGLFIFPAPNEVLLMASGYLATTYWLEPLHAFFIVYSSILFHGTLLFVLGKLISNQAFSFTDKPPSLLHRWTSKGKKVIQKHGLKAASFSYFFPFLRHAVPFTLGYSKKSFPLFAIVAYSSAFIWMSIYFFIGFYYGRTIKDWESFVEQMIITFASVVTIVFIIQFWRRKRKRMSYKTKACERR